LHDKQEISTQAPIAGMDISLVRLNVSDAYLRSTAEADAVDFACSEVDTVARETTLGISSGSLNAEDASCTLSKLIDTGRLRNDARRTKHAIPQQSGKHGRLSVAATPGTGIADMLAELLGLLAGHPSALFVPGPSSSTRPTTLVLLPAVTSHLHPGEVASLEVLGQLAFRYARVDQWTKNTLAAAKNAVLTSIPGRKGKARAAVPEDSQEAPGVYLVALSSTIQEILLKYMDLVVETEARVISQDGALVQNAEGFVPLSSLVAIFACWQAPMAALEDLVDTISSPPSTSNALSWTPGMLLDLINERTQTGYSHIASIFTSIYQTLYSLWLLHLSSFLFSGSAVSPSRATPSNPSIALDVGADPLSPRHRSYELNAAMFPSSVSKHTRDSILYTGRVTATLQREGRDLPRDMIAGLKDELRACGREDLSKFVNRARAEIGE
jgi:gamma-tubulin complex component 4